MPRKTRAEKQADTRAALMASAANCFARVGFEAAAIDVITEDAGFSRGAFYSNFGSKDELFLLLLKQHLEDELATLKPTLDKVTSAEDLVERTQRRYRKLGQDTDWCLLSSEFQLYAMRGGPQAGAFKKVYDDYRVRLGAMISECCERIGLQLSITPYEFGVAQIALSHGLSLQRASNPKIRQSLTAEALAIFARGAQP